MGTPETNQPGQEQTFQQGTEYSRLEKKTKVMNKLAGMMANAAMQGGVLTIGIGLAEGNKSVLLSGVTTWLLGGANRLNYHANRQSREVRERLRSDRNIPRG